MNIALGMSGGVDSSLCAHLLTEQGHQVTGVYLECWRAPGCRAEEDRADALKVALSLNLPFQVLDFKEAYRKNVVDWFLAEYRAGRTPNPDTICNREIKFGLFYDWALREGFDVVATGHYAATNSKGGLLIPTDQHKDQTYFLYLLKAEQLQHIVFPLGSMQKDQVRKEASTRQIHTASKPDSVGICFIGDINVRGFLKTELGENPGDVVDTHSRVIGTHQGLWFYTIGQRHGFTVDKGEALDQRSIDPQMKDHFPALYVIGKNVEKNQLIVGRGAETLQDHFRLTELHWIAGKPPTTFEGLLVRIRHTGELIPCMIDITTLDSAQITIHHPIRGIAEGQAGVLYQRQADDTVTVCLGGGVIST